MKGNGPCLIKVPTDWGWQIAPVGSPDQYVFRNPGEAYRFMRETGLSPSLCKLISAKQRKAESPLKCTKSDDGDGPLTLTDTIGEFVEDFEELPLDGPDSAIDAFGGNDGEGSISAMGAGFEDNPQITEFNHTGTRTGRSSCCVPNCSGVARCAGHSATSE